MLDLIQSLPGELIRNPWIEFADADGTRICQPDAVWRREDGDYVIEIKLKQCEAGYAELDGLYLPVVRRWLGAEPKGLLVCWAMREERPPMFYGPDADVSILDDEIGTWFLRI